MYLRCFRGVCQVASIYRDASIGNAINIVVVKIVVLEADQVDAFFFRQGVRVLASIVCLSVSMITRSCG